MWQNRRLNTWFKSRIISGHVDMWARKHTASWHVPSCARWKISRCVWRVWGLDMGDVFSQKTSSYDNKDHRQRAKLCQGCLKQLGPGSGLALCWDAYVTDLSGGFGKMRWSWFGTIWQIGDLREPRMQVQPPGPAAGCKNSSRVKKNPFCNWTSFGSGTNGFWPLMTEHLVFFFIRLLCPYAKRYNWCYLPRFSLSVQRSSSLERKRFNMEMFFTSFYASIDRKLNIVLTSTICDLFHHSEFMEI